MQIDAACAPSEEHPVAAVRDSASGGGLPPPSHAHHLLDETETVIAAQCFMYSLRQVSESLRRYFHPSCAADIPVYDVDEARKEVQPTRDQLPIGRRLRDLVWPINIPLLISSLRSAIILGVGSVFVLVPSLAAKFEQGTWILTAMVSRCTCKGMCAAHKFAHFEIVSLSCVSTVHDSGQHRRWRFPDNA